jgi:hypothetical protein
MLVTVVRDPKLLKPLTAPEKTKIGFGYFGVLCVASYVAAVGILHNTNTIGKESIFAYALIPLVLVQLLLMVPLRSCGKRTEVDLSNPVMENRLLINGSDSFNDTILTHHRNEGPTAVRGATLVSAILCLDFWLIFGVLLVGTGAGLTVINNVSSLTQSLGGSQTTGDLLVTLTSIANCAGRMVGGIMSDTFAKRLHRPGWLVVDLVLMTIAQVALAVSPLQYVYPGILLSGFCYGAFWSLAPSFLADRFGPRAFGAINSLSSFSTALSTYIFSVGMAATLYQDRIAPGGGTKCVGQHCFNTSFGVLALLCAGIAVPFSLWLTLRTRQLYDANGAILSYAEIEALTMEAPWKMSTRRRCLRGCGCMCGAWGRGLVVAPEEQSMFESRGFVAGDKSEAGSSWDEDGLHGLLRSNGVVLQN